MKAKKVIKRVRASKVLQDRHKELASAVLFKEPEDPTPARKLKIIQTGPISRAIQLKVIRFILRLSVSLRNALLSLEDKVERRKYKLFTYKIEGFQK